MIEWRQLDNTNFWISEYGDLFNRKTNRKVKAAKTRKGYLIFRMPGTKLSLSPSIHRIVAFFWIGSPPNASHQVNHKDGNKLNNHYSNLEYLTCKENINHAINLGLRTRKSNLKSNAILEPSQVSKIKNMFVNGAGNHDIAKMFGVCHSTISKIRTGKNWSHVA